MLRRRPTRVGGALTFPNWWRLLRRLMIERSLHSAASAICDVFSDSLSIISRIISSFEGGSLGAILRNDVGRLGVSVVQTS